MVKYFAVILFLICLLTESTQSQSYADSGYYYQNIGFREKAAGFFEEYLYSNPDNYQVRLDLAYLYQNMKLESKAREQFEYVSTHSPNENEVKLSKDALANIDKQTTPTVNNGQNNTSTVPVTYADSGYYYLNQGNKTKAAEYFEKHIQQNPGDTKVRMQVAYIYYEQKKTNSALKHFDYVRKHSTNSVERESARSAASVIKEQQAIDSKRSFDLYFYNYYDSYQENYIANLVSHVNFRIGKNTYVGPYLDVYTDSRSTATNIYNDRFVELGGFFRYNFLNNLFFEFRIGYAHQFNKDTSSINIKPLLVYFNRLSTSGSSKTTFYIDMYYAAMYDLKYRNSFMQGSFYEVVRFNTGGYSYIENYLVQTAQFDSRRLSYNNYVEVGTGVRYHPNIEWFPTFFVEPTYKMYFFGETKNSFQLKGGFWFYFKTAL